MNWRKEIEKGLMSGEKKKKDITSILQDPSQDPSHWWRTEDHVSSQYNVSLTSQLISMMKRDA